MHKLTHPITLALLLFFSFQIQAQNSTWELDRVREREAAKQKLRDSLANSLNKRWALRIDYGGWFFSQQAKSTEDELFFLPPNANRWRFGLSWHPAERFSADLSLGIQQSRDLPSSIDIGAVLSGNDIEVEGGGAAFVPLELGLTWYPIKNREFLPYVSLSSGLVIARGQYIRAQGNLSSGLDQTEIALAEEALTAKLGLGFEYLLSRHVAFSMGGSYYLSSDFEETLGDIQASRALSYMEVLSSGPFLYQGNTDPKRKSVYPFSIFL